MKKFLRRVMTAYILCVINAAAWLLVIAPQDRLPFPDEWLTAPIAFVTFVVVYVFLKATDGTRLPDPL